MTLSLLMVVQEQSSTAVPVKRKRESGPRFSVHVMSRGRTWNDKVGKIDSLAVCWFKEQITAEILIEHFKSRGAKPRDAMIPQIRSTDSTLEWIPAKYAFVNFDSLEVCAIVLIFLTSGNPFDRMRNMPWHWRTTLLSWQQQAWTWRRKTSAGSNYKLWACQQALNPRRANQQSTPYGLS